MASTNIYNGFLEGVRILSPVSFCWNLSARMATFARILSARISAEMVATYSPLPLMPKLVYSAIGAYP